MRKLPLLFVGLLLATALTGMGGVGDVGWSGGLAARDPTPRNIHDDFARLAACVPGFGGLYFDERGDITVYVLSPDRVQEEEVRACITRVFGSQILTQAFGGRLEGRRSAIVLQRGLYTFVDLLKWFDELEPVLDIEGTWFVDLDEARNRLVVGVEDLRLSERIRAMVSRQRIPEGAVIVKKTEPIEYDVLELSQVVQPTLGGARILFSDSGCTLGFNATLGGRTGFVTNSHCTDVQGSVTGTVYQSVGIQLGVEFRDPPYYQCGYPGFYRSCRRSDSAFVHYDEGLRGRSFRLGEIFRTTYWRGPAQGPGSTTIDPDKPTMPIVGSHAYPFNGVMVDKVGAKTGWTYGFVNRTCATANVNAYVDGRRVRLYCQDRANFTADKGDSGAPVFYWNRDYSAVLCGLHWGGSGTGSNRRSWFSSLGRVELDLGPLITH